MKVFKNDTKDVFQKTLPALLFILALLFVIMLGLRQLELSGRAQGRRLLEEGIRHAAISHYATEGSYPPGLGYIEENYGIYIDRSRYAAFYEIFAPNIMPGITVVELK